MGTHGAVTDRFKSIQKRVLAQQLRTRRKVMRTPIEFCRDVHAVRLASQAALPTGTPALDCPRAYECSHACTSAGLSRSLLHLLILSVAASYIASSLHTSDLDIPWSFPLRRSV